MPERARLSLDGEAQPVIADVTDTPLDVLFASDDSALGNSLRRLILEINTQGEHYVAHNSSI